MRSIGFYFNLVIALLPIGLVSGCATNVPSGVSKAPAELVSVRQVQANAQAHEGRLVRWGGDIIKVENDTHSTDVEILGRTLERGGKPESGGIVDGRFVARIQGFLDPVEYAAGLRMTVSGLLSGLETHKVGEYNYPYPLVKVQAYHLWPKEKPRVYYPAHYYPWPYYGPWGWYPYRRYPYWWY